METEGEYKRNTSTCRTARGWNRDSFQRSELIVVQGRAIQAGKPGGRFQNARHRRSTVNPQLVCPFSQLWRDDIRTFWSLSRTPPPTIVAAGLLGARSSEPSPN